MLNLEIYQSKIYIPIQYCNQTISLGAKWLVQLTPSLEPQKWRNYELYQDIVCALLIQGLNLFEMTAFMPLGQDINIYKWIAR